MQTQVPVADQSGVLVRPDSNVAVATKAGEWADPGAFPRRITV